MLAIGLVVDDAIIVVEAVERHIEEGLSPKEAALKAMEEVSGPVMAIALILAAVFIPTVFIPGITGRLYQQFAVTIAISVLISAFNALTLSPALCALLLKPETKTHGPLGAFFDWFNRIFGRASERLRVRMRRRLIRKSALSLVFLAADRASSAGLSARASPRGFLPEEDQGYFYVNVALPDAASLQRTDDDMRQVEDILRKRRGSSTYQTVIGLQPLERCPEHLQRLLLRHPQGMGEAKEAGGAVRGHHGAPEPRAGEAARGGRLRLSSAGHSGHRHWPAGPRSSWRTGRARTSRFLAENVDKFVDAARKRPELDRVTHDVPPRRPADIS